MTDQGATLNQQPLVSVVIPTFNRAPMLHRAVVSALQQLWRNLEVLVVDDASTDNTAQVIAGFKDSRIVYVRHETNRGAAAARNSGALASKGEFLAFLDDDDEWLPSMLEECMAPFLPDPTGEVGVVGCDWTSHDAQGRQERYDIPADGWCFEDLLSCRYDICASGVIVRKDHLLAVDMFDETTRLVEDRDTFLRLAERSRFVRVPKPLVRVYSHDYGNMNTNENALVIRRRLVDKHLKHLEARPRVHARHLTSLSILHSSLGHRVEARRLLLRATRLDPLNPRLLVRLVLSLLGRSSPRSLRSPLRWLAGRLRKQSRTVPESQSGQSTLNDARPTARSRPPTDNQSQRTRG